LQTATFSYFSIKQTLYYCYKAITAKRSFSLIKKRLNDISAKT